MIDLVERLRKAKGSPTLKTVLLGMFDAERTCLEAATRIAELEEVLRELVDIIDNGDLKDIDSFTTQPARRALKTPTQKGFYNETFLHNSRDCHISMVHGVSATVGVFDMTELKPCPFCGGEAEYHSRANGERFIYANDVDHWVSCLGENCAASQGLYENKELAVAAWNYRTPPKAEPTDGAPDTIECQPWAVSNGISDWSEGHFGEEENLEDFPTVEYIRKSIYDLLMNNRASDLVEHLAQARNDALEEAANLAEPKGRPKIRWGTRFTESKAYSASVAAHQTRIQIAANIRALKTPT